MAQQTPPAPVAVCPACKAANPAANLYCGKCGASLKEAKVYFPASTPTAGQMPPAPVQKARVPWTKQKLTLFGLTITLPVFLLGACLLTLACGWILGQLPGDEAPAATATVVGEVLPARADPSRVSMVVLSKTPEPTAPAKATNTPRPTRTAGPTEIGPASLGTPRPTATSGPTLPPTDTPQPTPTPTITLTPSPLPPGQQLRQALIGTLRDSNRDVPRITSVTIDGTEIEVSWAINDNLTEAMIKHGAKMDVVDILETVSKVGLSYSAVYCFGTFPLVDAYGNTEEELVVSAMYTKETVDKINWDSFLTDNVYVVADDLWLHPVMQE